MTTGDIGAVIMAAGAGRRMGGKPKALLLRDGVPLIERHLRALAQAGIRQAVVVLGHHAARIEPLLRELQASLAEALELRWALNPRPDDGPGSSLRVGLGALPVELGAVLVALADQPLIEAADVNAVLRAWQGRGLVFNWWFRAMMDSRGILWCWIPGCVPRS
ncbi:nucleotidyltransferase family protein [Ottowia sp. VDI28]|uniref:nucleotidyltransferase family protein n=1 Tax=Ottowia sp. VDI28 TaxID=3133968 RepID=UPI003C2FF51B